MKTCETCKWHNVDRHMHNKDEAANGAFCVCPKLYEGGLSPDGEKAFARDHLVYSYIESGRFWTGHDFGCVHHCETRRQ